MASNDVSSNLAALVTAHKKTLHLIHRLQRLPAQPGSYNPEADARVELSAEIHQNLKEQGEELELLRQEVEEYSNGGARRRSSEKAIERERAVSTLAKLEEDLKSARTLFRKAQLQAKRNAETAKRKERELQLAGSRDGSNPPAPGRRKVQEKLTQDELTVNASNDVTAALRRTHHLMQSELSRSQFAQETLEQSTVALSSLSESYTSLDTLLSSSRSLVSTLLRSQKSDTWYLETAFYILVATICWLLFRRIFYGPLWWLVWLPVKLLYKFSVATLSATGILGAMAGSSATLSSTRSLIIQRSATGGIPTYAETMQPQSVVVGGGDRGGGFRQRMPSPDPSPASRSEGSQAEDTRPEERRPPRQPEDKPEQGERQQGGHAQGGTNVDDISEEERRRQQQIPRNPKKRMFEAEKEEAKRGQAKDEL